MDMKFNTKLALNFTHCCLITHSAGTITSTCLDEDAVKWCDDRFNLHSHSFIICWVKFTSDKMAKIIVDSWSSNLSNSFGVNRSVRSR